MKLELSLSQIEENLDAGCLKAPMRTSADGYSLWSVRRNGRTKTWKRDPMRFEIPVTIGFRHYATITPKSTFCTGTMSHPHWYDFKVMPQDLVFDPHAEVKP